MVCLQMTHSPDLRFATYGGFLLFDAAGTVVAAQAITFEISGDHLNFEPPAPFREEFVASLQEAGRLQQVRRPELKRHGAKQYCWIMPGEQLVSAAGKKWTPCESGAFVYTLEAESRLSELGGPASLIFKLVPHVTMAQRASHLIRQGTAHIDKGIRQGLAASDRGIKLAASSTEEVASFANKHVGGVLEQQVAALRVQGQKTNRRPLGVSRVCTLM